MKKLLALVFIFMAFVATSQTKSPITPTIRKLRNDTIIWKPDSLLKKEDFKAKPRSNGPLGLTASGILFYPSENTGELVFYVEALFVKSKSYLVKFSEYVLKHEQIHFDICELYARKLRKKISEINFKKEKNLVSVINKLYNRTSEDLQEEQMNYDKDTEHGFNAAKQKVWNEDIQKRIKELDQYSSTMISIN